MQDGTKLPSIRALKQQLNISKTTIETAYHLLLEEGYVASKERSGLVVINPSHLLASNPAAVSASFTSEGCCTETRETDKKPLIDFSLLTVDGDSFPIRLWKSIAGEALSQNSSFIHQYGDPRGEYALRVSLAQYLQHSRGVVCTPDQVIVGNGISYSIQLLSKLLEGETSVGIEKAGIAQVREAFEQNGLHPIPISMQTRKQLEQECSVYNFARYTLHLHIVRLENLCPMESDRKCCNGPLRQEGILLKMITMGSFDCQANQSPRFKAWTKQA